MELSEFSQHLFWDIDKNKIDIEKHKALIIERVMNRGNLMDLNMLLQTYGFNTIKHEIVNVGYLDKKTLNWAALFFNLKKSDFKCYTKMQSNQVHWNF